MDYNTSRPKLVIPEYGRNVQKLVMFARDIEDRAHRQAFVEKIVQMITQMYPQVRNVEDYRNKVWNHIFAISGYTLNVDAPCEILDPEVVHQRPEPVPYPHGKVKYKHYGKNVENMITKAINMEEGPKKVAFIEVIGSYMKLAYRSWNREYVNDEIIRHDLEVLSEGKVLLPQNANLDNLIHRKRNNSSHSGNRRNNNNGGYSRNNNGSNRDRDRDRGDNYRRKRY